MDHHDHIDSANESAGPFAAGWLWALVAAVVTVVLARWFGTPMTGAVLVALGVFVVFAVLLAQFWEPPAGETHGDDHGHGHGHH
jgi:O-antigen/teichoic acid export membrane protein